LSRHSCMNAHSKKSTREKGEKKSLRPRAREGSPWTMRGIGPKSTLAENSNYDGREEKGVQKLAASECYEAQLWWQILRLCLHQRGPLPPSEGR